MSSSNTNFVDGVTHPHTRTIQIEKATGKIVNPVPPFSFSGCNNQYDRTDALIKESQNKTVKWITYQPPLADC